MYDPAGYSVDNADLQPCRFYKVLVNRAGTGTSVELCDNTEGTVGSTALNVFHQGPLCFRTCFSGNHTRGEPGIGVEGLLFPFRYRSEYRLYGCRICSPDTSPDVPGMTLLEHPVSEKGYQAFRLAGAEYPPVPQTEFEAVVTDRVMTGGNYNESVDLWCGTDIGHHLRGCSDKQVAYNKTGGS